MELDQQQKELLSAIASGDLCLVKHLVAQKGVSPNFWCEKYVENNPICAASLAGNFDISFWLVKKGGAIPSLDVFSFISCVLGDISTTNLLSKEIKKGNYREFYQTKH